MTAKTVLKNVIAGESAEPADGRYADLVDPVTGEVFASAPVWRVNFVESTTESRSSATRRPTISSLSPSV